MIPGPAPRTRRFAARVLSDLIGDSDCSRFLLGARRQRDCRDADFGFYPHDMCGSFYLSLTTAPIARPRRWTSRSRSAKVRST